MTRIFVDRVRELKSLDETYRSQGFKLVIVYGRRRIGKTALIKKFMENKVGIYFLCSQRGIKKDLARFSDIIAEKLNLPRVRFESFIDAFKFLKQFDGLVVAIDEFPYLIESDKTIVSEFQIVVDEVLSDSNLMLILFVSRVGMIEMDVLSYKFPLYGRAKKIIKIKPLDIDGLVEWFGSDLEKIVKIYGTTNGIPKYMEFFEGKNVEEEIIKNFFNADSFLYNEAYILLSEELRSPHTYSLILEAISLGNTRLSEISNYTGIEAKDLPFYLNVLSNLGIVKREVPITEKKRSRKGIYLIEDEYFRFWFRFVSPHKEEIESFESDRAIEDFRTNFNHYLGFTFEKLAKQFLIRLNAKGMLPFRFTRIGKWWHKQEEIDWIALNDKEKKALFVEVKWSDLSSKDVKKILKNLEKKSELVVKGYKHHYMLIARSVKERVDELMILDLRDLEKFVCHCNSTQSN